MKNSVTAVLLCITLIFASFVAGFYTGKNTAPANTEISGFVDLAARPPKATDSTTPPSSSNATPTSSSYDAPTEGTTSPAITYPININTATLEQLDMLPGIGPVLAQRILDYRAEIGQFTSVDELLDVSGIGEKTLAKMLEYITV